MRFAVGYVQLAACRQDTVRTRQLTAERNRLRPVAPLTRTEHGGDDARPQVDAANDVTLGIGDEQRAVRPIRESLRAVQRGIERSPTIAGISADARAGDAMKRLRLGVDAINRVTFPEREIHIAVGGHSERPRSMYRGGPN